NVAVWAPCLVAPGWRSVPAHTVANRLPTLSGLSRRNISAAPISGKVVSPPVLRRGLILEGIVQLRASFAAPCAPCRAHIYGLGLMASSDSSRPQELKLTDVYVGNVRMHKSSTG